MVVVAVGVLLWVCCVCVFVVVFVCCLCLGVCCWCFGLFGCLWFAFELGFTGARLRFWRLCLIVLFYLILFKIKLNLLVVLFYCAYCVCDWFTV